jgi:hypothetical protein
MNTCKRMECRTLKKNLKVDVHVKKYNENWGQDMFDTMENITDKDRDNEE